MPLLLAWQELTGAAAGGGGTGGGGGGGCGGCSGWAGRERAGGLGGWSEGMGGAAACSPAPDVVRMIGADGAGVIIHFICGAQPLHCLFLCCVRRLRSWS